MNVYDYVASSNPSESRNIITSFGYKIKGRNMGQNLKQLVALEGEPALRMVMDSHPDKDVILEMFQSESKSTECSTCKERDMYDTIYHRFLNANGGEKYISEAKRSENSFNVVFLAGAMLISFAILSSK
jgi:hypothetical protein